jgi:TPR repeat protein
MVEAVRYYGLAAAQGNADAQNNLGYCYQHGEGVAHDMVEAVRYYGLAAAQGNADAQYNLASCYERGEGVAHDVAHPLLPKGGMLMLMTESDAVSACAHALTRAAGAGSPG